MGKEYIWKLPTENGEKEITCQADGNKYHIYIGDAFVTSVYKNMSGNADVELTLGGVPCRFVSFADTPDLVVDGKMIGSGKLYEAEKSRQRKNTATWAMGEIFIGIFALVIAVVWAVQQANFVSHIPAFAVSLLFIIFGAVELYNLNKKK
ncbi:MAG: hypothetical protein IJX27_09670 [Clostridia bacterium]|nr:hypothetical protein [Clostridia bacterium]